MRTGWIALLICLFVCPGIASAGGYPSAFRSAMAPAAIVPHGDGRGSSGATLRRSWKQRSGRHPFGKRSTPKPIHPIHPGHGHDKPIRPPIHGHPRYWWPATTTVVKEVPTVIVVQPPPPATPEPPKPKEVWVPPVMDTRIEPGYWDYGVREVWMGDHWRYDQDVTEKTWVPASQVTYVKQAGYWKVVE